MCGAEACALCRCPPVCQIFLEATSWIETQPLERCAGFEVLLMAMARAGLSTVLQAQNLMVLQRPAK